ncbi:MAG: TlpA family protein disulfide reductase [Chromatiales bacterium]|nr:TlpA family protein disulfide reductase [Gammaproteobacteria bacterium]MCP5352640.1 TlpA family protein disulfide reductase [Chromatiales bacterium]
MTSIRRAISALALWTLWFSQIAAALETVTVDTPAHGEVLAHRTVAPAPTATLIWLLSEHGLTEGVSRLADGLAARGLDVWLLDPFQSWFLPTAPSSLAEFNRDALAAAVASIASQTGRPVFLASNDRAGGALLETAQRLPTGIARGILLISPNVYRNTPAPGQPAAYLPATATNRLPVFLMIPRQSTLYIRQADLQTQLGSGGAPVWIETLADVRDRFFFRPDASARENLAGEQLPLRIARTLRLLANAPQAVSTASLPALPRNEEPAPAAPPTRTLRPHTGDPLPPPLSLVDLDGRERSLADHRGKVVLVNFWASWCPPCVHEMPSMARLQTRLGNEEFAILAVNLGEPRDAIQAFLTEHPVNFPVLLDENQRMPRSWRVFAYPTSYLLDRQGRIRHAVAGGLEWDEPDILATIQTLIAEPARD